MITLKNQLCDALREKSGLEHHRPYLGMSGIGQCPRKLYFEFVNGRRPPTDQQHWYCWTGYVHEAAIVDLLAGEKKLAEQIEVIAAFDSRFRGHVDYVIDGQLIEIKSTAWNKFTGIKLDNRPQREHLEQVQMYMRHGGWTHTQIIYVARDVPHREFDGPPFWIFDVYPDKQLADKLDQKARDILAAIDRHQPPRCECGYCRD